MILAADSCTVFCGLFCQQTQQSNERADLLAFYSRTVKSVVDWMRMASGLSAKASFTFGFNQQLLFADEEFAESASKLGKAFSTFKPLPLLAVSQESLLDFLGRSQAKGRSCRLIVISNAFAQKEWEDLLFEIHFVQKRSNVQISVPSEVLVFQVGSGGIGISFCSKQKIPIIHLPLCSLEQSMRISSILLNEANVVRIEQIPMKKISDSGKRTFCNVDFVVQRDLHVIGPAFEDYFADFPNEQSQLDFFLQHRYLSFHWAKKGSIEHSSLKCSHSLTPLDGCDSATCAILDQVVENGGEFLLGSSANSTPVASISVRNGRLFFSCLHYLSSILQTNASFAAGSQYIPSLAAGNAAYLELWTKNAIAQAISMNQTNKCASIAITQAVYFIYTSKQLRNEEMKNLLVSLVSLNVDGKIVSPKLDEMLKVALETKSLARLEECQIVLEFLGIVEDISQIHQRLYTGFTKRFAQLKQ